ncbi:MAG: hypothetical protein ACOX0M_08065 [Salinivirgaceae bacterium]|jgi:hypothetical protein|nr:hypothetical protein [Bacteroidales bacterium]
MRQISLILVLIIFAIVENFAQAPVIWTVSGDSIVVREVEDFQDTSLISIKYKSMRERWTDIDRQDIFSIKLSDDNLHYLYQPLFEGDKNLDQMKLYIDGHREGYKGKTYGAFLIGFASGSLGMLLPPDNIYVAPLFPLTAVICVGKFSGKKTINFNDENFIEGYSQRRKKQNIKSAIWGGLSGLAVGVTGSFLIYGWGVK